MTIALLLLVGVAGTAGSAWALPRGGAIARLGAVVGLLALVLLGLLAGASGTPDPATVASGSAAAWNGALVPNGYLRFVLVLAAIDGVVLAGIAWLLGGLVGMRGLLPATLAAMTGTTIALAAADPVVGALGAAGAGLAALPALLAAPRPSTAATAAREIRIALATSVVLVAAAGLSPVVARLVLADPDGAAHAGSAPMASIGLAVLATAVALAGRAGVIPFHVRIAALTDAAPPITLPLLLAWIPLPFAVVSLTAVDELLAPLALPLGTERAVIVVVTLLTLAAAALAAFLADDLRHATGYLVIADTGIALLGIAALDPAAWGPARVWLVAVAASKTALAAWSAVTEERFETRSIPDLRGWVHPAPILAAGLVTIMVATFGLPGWVAFEARGSLATIAAGSPWNVLLVVAGFLTLPTYFRILALGFGPATSHVDRAAPERVPPARLPRRRGRVTGLEVEQEGAEVASAGTAASAGGAPAIVIAAPEAVGEKPGVVAASAARRRPTSRSRVAAPVPDAASASVPRSDPAAVHAGTGANPVPAAAAGGETGRITPSRRGGVRTAGSRLAVAAAVWLRRDRAELLSAGVLALALLASLVAWGVLDIGQAAAEPAPAVSGIGVD